MSQILFDKYMKEADKWQKIESNIVRYICKRGTPGQDTLWYPTGPPLFTKNFDF